MSRNRLINARTLVLGGLAVAAVAGALKNRHKVAGLIGARSSAPEPYTYTPPSPAEDAPPPIANYDAPGPPANTATPIPAPEPVVQENHPIEEEAEEAAAAAEAANIGGPAPDYSSSTLGEQVDEADRPVEESGEGVSEGLEQDEAELQDYAEPAAGDAIQAERQIDEVIAQADNPTEGETLEVHDHLHTEEPTPAEKAGAGEPSSQGSLLRPETLEEGAPTTSGTAAGTTGEEESTSAGSALGETAKDEEAGGDETTGTGSALGETPAAEKSSAVWKSDDDDDSDDGGSEWQTWSGRAVDR